MLFLSLFRFLSMLGPATPGKSWSAPISSEEEQDEEESSKTISLSNRLSSFLFFSFHLAPCSFYFSFSFILLANFTSISIILPPRSFYAVLSGILYL